MSLANSSLNVATAALTFPHNLECLHGDCCSAMAEQSRSFAEFSRKTESNDDYGNFLIDKCCSFSCCRNIKYTYFWIYLFLSRRTSESFRETLVFGEEQQEQHYTPGRSSADTEQANTINGFPAALPWCRHPLLSSATKSIRVNTSLFERRGNRKQLFFFFLNPLIL